MNQIAYQIRIIFQKECIDLRKNANVLMMLLLPLFLAVLYSFMFQDHPEELKAFTGLVLLMNLTMCAMVTVAMLIAEEKEKNTMKTLLLSGVSPIAFLGGKLLFTLLVSSLVNVVVYVLFKAPLQYLAAFLLLSLPLALCMLLIGALIGLYSKNQMSTGVMGAPVGMIMLIMPLMALVNKSFEPIAHIMPSYQTIYLINQLVTGASVFANWQSWAVLAVWITGAYAAFYYGYQKRPLR